MKCAERALRALGEANVGPEHRCALAESRMPSRALGDAARTLPRAYARPMAPCAERVTGRRFEDRYRTMPDAAVAPRSATLWCNGGTVASMKIRHHRRQPPGEPTPRPRALRLWRLRQVATVRRSYASSVVMGGEHRMSLVLDDRNL